MKSSLAELIEQAQSYRRWLESTLHAQAQEILEARSAGLSEARIQLLYPLNMDEYESGFARLIRRLEGSRSSEALRKLSDLSIGRLEAYLPSETVDSATQYRSNLYSHLSRLRIITYYCYELADFDHDELAVMPGEAEAEAENAWGDALHFFHPVAQWLDEALQLVRSERLRPCVQPQV